MNNKERFLSKVEKTDNCWLFTGGISTTGYGVFWLNGKNENSHKAAYILLVGDTMDKWVLHTCDNKKCVNPNHLYLGNREQNTKDAVDRNRMATGEKHGSKTTNRDYSFDKNPFGKLSKENCIAIKRAVDDGVSKVWIANLIGVNLSTVYRAAYKADALINELNQPA